MEDGWLTVEEAAKKRKVHKNTVYKAIEGNKLHPRRLSSRMFLLRWEEVADWAIGAREGKKADQEGERQ